MHPKKAEVLEKLESASRTLDTHLREQFSVAVRPDRHGLRRSLGAAATLPITTFGALIVDVSSVLAARTEDSGWEAAYPTGGGDPTAPPNEHLT